MKTSYDVIVIGAGVSGICAAVQAARAGAETLLVEKSGIGGGTLTLSAVNKPAIFNLWGRQVRKTLLETGDELPDFTVKDTSDHCAMAITVNPLIFAAITDETLENAGVACLFHTLPATVCQLGDQTWDIEICGKEGIARLQAKILIDCTGDANIVSMAGLQCEKPSRCQPGTFSVDIDYMDFSKIDFTDVVRKFSSALSNNTLQASDIGWCGNDIPTHPEQIKSLVMHFLNRHGWNANHIKGINGFNSEAKTRMELAGRRSVLRAYRFFKSCRGLENIRFNLLAMECGVRETRRIIAKTKVTYEDYLNGTLYSDSICFAGYPIDLHDEAKGLDVRCLAPGISPTVPFSALIPKGAEGILAAGRIIGSDRLANSALRIQATCMATGQVAGAAAALAVKRNCQICEIPINILKNLLIKNHAIVP
jgi:hypothetical protein